jgi:hypothetical protein
MKIILPWFLSAFENLLTSVCIGLWIYFMGGGGEIFGAGEIFHGLDFQDEVRKSYWVLSAAIGLWKHRIPSDLRS